MDAENDDSNSEEEPISSTRQASQTQTQSHPPIRGNAELGVRGQGSTQSAKSVGKQQVGAHDSVDFELENASEEEPAPSWRRASQTHPLSQTKHKDKRGNNDESDAN